MFDSRYPWMFRVAHAPGLSPDERAEAVRTAGAITRRTGTNCSFNARTGALFFHYTVEPDSGPLSLPVHDDDGHCRRYAAHEIDEAVRFIQLGKVSRAQKERWARNERQREEWKKNDAFDAHRSEREPDVLNYAAFRDRARRGVAKVISA